LTTVLIVESDPELGRVWAEQIAKAGVSIVRATSEHEAVEALAADGFGAIVLSLMLPGGGALAVADVASYRQPEARVIFVTSGDAYSNGSIFAFSSNATAILQSDVRPEDLAAIVEYHAAAR
jgi:DNA-binding response OmpR family regulator